MTVPDLHLVLFPISSKMSGGSRGAQGLRVFALAARPFDLELGVPIGAAAIALTMG